ncbi:MAG: hypothetical protein GWO08_11665, partial [Gammaproteobacteria bacterium]|nr:hypothetical protein [Gammaproteobacteria bacterium]NIR94288.1 hypothetical protein [Gammaproteobacteria bacterium]
EAVFELDLVLQGGQQPDPLACFAVNKMKVHQHDGKIYINKGAFALPEDAAVDLSQTDVSFSIDGLVYTIPAGSFIYDDGKYTYKSPHGQVPAIKVKLDFLKYKWSLKVRDPQAATIDNVDGVDVVMAFAGFQASENIVMTEKHNDRHHHNNYHDHDKVMLKFKRKPKVRCGPQKEHHHEHDDDGHEGHHHANDEE